MQIIKSDMIVFCDCDDTLLMWDQVEWWLSGPDKIEIEDPYDQSLVYLKPHPAHISLLRKYKAQGYTVIVWSANGYRWAEVVVNILKLEDTVDICMSKSLKFVDDLPAKEILGTRVYIPFGMKNKVIEPGELE